MSRDQKPGKLRMVGTASAVAHRRRGDVEPVRPAGTPVAAAGKVAAANAATSKKPILIAAILFLAGCAVGGAALPLLGVL